MNRHLLLLLPIILLALFACKKENSGTTPEPPVTPDTPAVAVDKVLLTYDSTNVTVIATPGDSVSNYVLQVWLVEDYIIDYGNDFSDEAVAANLASFLDLCIQWKMQFPIFNAVETSFVYDWFEQPYYATEHIAMAASYDENTRKINGPVTFIRFTTPAL